MPFVEAVAQKNREHLDDIKHQIRCVEENLLETLGSDPRRRAHSAGARRAKFGTRAGRRRSEPATVRRIGQRGPRA